MTFAQLMTTEEAAFKLGVSRSWLKKQAAAGLVPCTRLGRSVRFSEAHLEIIAKAGEQVPIVAAPMIARRRLRARP